MLVLVTYDVETVTRLGRKRLSKIAKECCNYGQRVQNSVFECNIDNATYVMFRAKLLKIIDENSDSIRFYNLGNKYSTKIEQYGVKRSYDANDVLML